LRKIAFNVASASGGRSKKNAQERKNTEGMSERDRGGRKYEMSVRTTKMESWQKEDDDEKQRQQERERCYSFN